MPRDEAERRRSFDSAGATPEEVSPQVAQRNAREKARRKTNLNPQCSSIKRVTEGPGSKSLGERDGFAVAEPDAELFQTSIPNVSMHIRNVFAEGEVQEAATVKGFLTVRQEGSRRASRSVESRVMVLSCYTKNKRASFETPIRSPLRAIHLRLRGLVTTLALTRKKSSSGRG